MSTGIEGTKVSEISSTKSANNGLSKYMLIAGNGSPTVIKFPTLIVLVHTLYSTKK